jgi:Putative DNA-binding domain
MLALHDLQRSIGRSVLGQLDRRPTSTDDPDAAGAMLAEGMTERLWIYRHHYETSLVEALKAIYPAICRLVDERFFEYAAHEYVRANPPRRPCLHEYGEGFPQFLAGFPPCRKLVYLADVARLEWRINAALHAPAEPPLAPGAFRGIGPEEFPRLVFHLLPSAGYLESAWPVDRIWLGEEEVVDLGEGGCRLEIRQRGEEVVFARLDEPQFTLRRALAAGHRMENALATALATDPLFDLALALRQLLEEGLVTGFSLAPNDSATSL